MLTPEPRTRSLHRMIETSPHTHEEARQDGLDPDWVLVFICWLIAAGSTLGSLFFSYVMEFPPCDMCWYQRICLFPLVIILGRGLFPFDPSVVKYALPLAAAGGLLAFYHNLLYTGVVPASLQPCTQGGPGRTDA